MHIFRKIHVSNGYSSWLNSLYQQYHFVKGLQNITNIGKVKEVTLDFVGQILLRGLLVQSESHNSRSTLAKTFIKASIYIKTERGGVRRKQRTYSFSFILVVLLCYIYSKTQVTRCYEVICVLCSY